MDEPLYKRVLARQRQLEDLRKPYEPLWEEVIKYLRPELTPWTSTTPDSKGEKRNIDVYSGGPEEGLEVWSDGNQGHLVSSSLDWFGYQMAQRRFNEMPVVRRWTQDCRDAGYSIFADSNFYPALGPVFRDAGSIGDTTVWMDTLPGPSLLEFRTFHPREVFHGPEGDVFHRKFEMTAMRAEEVFGKDKLSRALNECLTNNRNPFMRFTFIHVCYAKGDIILKGESGVPDRPFICFYIQENTDPDKQKPLKMEGYHTKPYARWRYFKASDAIYGWGPGCSAIVDVVGLHAVVKDTMRAQQMAVNPPVWAHRSFRGRLNLLPGGRNYYERADETIAPVFNNPNFPAGLDREERLALAIDRRFNVDFFLMLARAEKPMTATEIAEKVGERSILMAPKIGRMERDLLDPIHDRLFDVAVREGWFAPPPDILRYQSDGRIDVQYLGPLAQAQKRLFESRRNQRILESVGPVLQLSPDSKDYIKGDKSVVRILRENQWPEDEIATPEEVEAMRQQRAQLQAAAAQMQMAAQAVEAVPKLSKAVEPNSPLAAMAGGKA